MVLLEPNSHWDLSFESKNYKLSNL
ncbi:hypothetical protein KVMX100_121342 [Klebsiella variicola]|nr:hypothetical protein KVMX100_121342 [Klebsiella variicola]